MELQPKSAPEEEAFLRVWQRVSAPASAPPPPPSPQSWDEAGFLAAAMDDLRRRKSLCSGALGGVYPALCAMQRRLAAVYYLLTGQRHTPSSPERLPPMTAPERCREQYRAARTAAAAFDRAAREGQERAELYQSLAEENRGIASRVEEITCCML